jgi:hypothetical protein
MESGIFCILLVTPMKSLLIVAAFVISFSVSAQHFSIDGIVKDKTGHPIPGVGVMIKGSTNGTTTDVDGKFKLSGKPDDTLVISFIGFQTQEVPVNGRDNINVILKEDCIVCFFDGRDVHLNLKSGILKTPAGAQITVARPLHRQTIIVGKFLYQTNFSENK